MNVSESIERAASGLLAGQHADGHWCFELEADCTIPAEYILMMHYMGEIETERQEKLANYLRSKQTAEGGWPLYYGGAIDISGSVKSYYALKLAGDSPTLPHMQKARAAILHQGGASKANVFTRILLAMFGQVPWRAAPYMPVELMLLPRWFFFHLDKIAYWSRTVMVPLLILCTLKAKARNPTRTGVRELFVVAPEKERHWFTTKTTLAKVFLGLDEIARRLDWMIPRTVRTRALNRAEAWFVERLNGEDGLGAIFPAMVNAYEAMDILGYPENDPRKVTARRAIEKLMIDQGTMAYYQPCVSPVWDTSLACHALIAADNAGFEGEIGRALEWLGQKQITEFKGDWAVNAPDVPAGGWAFQYANDHYPDLDDTAVVAWAMDRSNQRDEYATTIDRARVWIEGTQSDNGGYAAFDVNNTWYKLNEIPFADHGALLDPPTADVTGRCLALLGRLDNAKSNGQIASSIEYLKREQDKSGAWFGRWGTNYIYGTWSVLTALVEAGIDVHEPYVRRATSWLKSVQRPDGGWGEDNDAYEFDGPDEPCKTSNQGSTSYQTAWALLALIACGEAGSVEVQRGIKYLLETQNTDGLWEEPWYTAPGFPRVFYLKYHGYSKYFPLWALAEYRKAGTQSK